MITPPEPWPEPSDIYAEQYASCRKHQKETNYVKCESCINRFVCWTVPKLDESKPYRDKCYTCYMMD